MSIILKKCDEIQSACNDHFAISHLKINSQKISNFLTKAEDVEDNGNDYAKNNETPIIPECNSTDRKRVLDETANSVPTTKKIKYESPLEFQRTENSKNK